MPMGTIILEKRKELGWTQRQVAEYLGVSVPAVSKWEKGIASPDIGLLPSLARLLKTDLNALFCFHEVFPAQEMGAFCSELASLAGRDLVSAFEMAEAKLHDFPYDEQLRLNVAIVLDAALLQTSDADVPKEAYGKRISSWYADLGKSADEKIQNSANFMRVGRYIRQDKLDAAQEVLNNIRDKREIAAAFPDKQMLQVSIYLKRGEAEQAALELEKMLFQEASKVQMLLTRLAEAELAAGEKAVAEEIAEKSKDTVALLDLWEGNKYIAPYQIVAQEKDADAMLSLLEKMLKSLKKPWGFTESALYHRMAPEAKQFCPDEILAMVLEGLENDPDCEYLREHPKGKALLAKYKR